jgi:hypothetical protein
VLIFAQPKFKYLPLGRKLKKPIYHTLINSKPILILKQQTMKKVLFISFLAIFTILSSCKKEEDVDPRLAFVGSWAGTQTIAITSLGLSDSFNFNQTISLSADDNKKILLTSDGEILKATVSGSSYTYDKYSYTSDDGSGNTMTIEMQGTGTISGNKINETGTVKLYYLGGEYPGTWSSTLTKQ